MQDEVARKVLLLAGSDQALFQLQPEEERSFATSLEQAKRREFASDDQLRAVAISKLLFQYPKSGQLTTIATMRRVVMTPLSVSDLLPAIRR